MNKTLRRSVVALATAFACLALMGSPASAAVITADITAGTVTLINSTGTTTDDIALGPGVTTLGANCANSIAVTTTASTTSISNWNITTFAVVARFKLGGTWYVASLQRTGSVAGTVTAVTTTSATLNSATLNLDARIFTTAFQNDTDTECTTNGNKCRFSGVALSLQGTYSGDLHNPAVSDTASLNGTGTLGATSPPCTTPFTTYNNGTVAVTGLVAHVLSVVP